MNENMQSMSQRLIVIERQATFDDTETKDQEGRKRTCSTAFSGSFDELSNHFDDVWIALHSLTHSSKADPATSSYEQVNHDHHLLSSITQQLSD